MLPSRATQQGVKKIDPERLVRDVGRRIGELRADKDMTQEALATAAGVGTRYVQRVEAGRENLTIRSLALLASVLRVSVRELFEVVSRSMWKRRDAASA